MSTSDNNPNHGKSAVRSWLFIFVLAASFLAWGFLLFYTIGDKGPPPWDFGIVRDIPGESVFSTHQPLPGKVSDPDPQHVSGRPGAVEGGEREKGGK
jgi:hypothetical protein